MKDQPHFFLLGDVSRMLRCQPHRIVYLFSTGQLPEPARLGGRRLFKKADVDVIAERLGINLQSAAEGSPK